VGQASGTIAERSGAGVRLAALPPSSISTREVPVAAEQVRARLRRRLAEEYGMDEADLLLDHPPGGWDALVTKEWVHLELSVVDARFASIDARFDSIDAQFAAVESRLSALESRMTAVELRLTSIDDRLSALASELHAQTWKLIGAMSALLGVFVAAIKL